MKKTTKRSNKGWGQVYRWVKNAKLEPPKESVYGCVYYALRKLKEGSVAEVSAEAQKLGLHKVCKQNPHVQTQIKLRRMVRLGAAKVEKMKDESKTPKAETKTKVKAPAAKKAAPKKAAIKKVAPKKEESSASEPDESEEPDEDADEESESSDE